MKLGVYDFRGWFLNYIKNLRIKVYFDEELLDKPYVFRDRVDGGGKLADLISKAGLHVDYVVAIPCGGVPVGVEVSRRLNIPLELVIVRKILIPWNREAGYGAVAPDGRYVLNDELVSILNLPREVVEEGVRETLNEVLKREKMFRCGKGYGMFKGRELIVVDDGLASGYTMKVAVEFLKDVGASKVYVGTPTASPRSIELLSKVADAIVAVNVRDDSLGFAVADAYMYWRDVSEEEVLELLEAVGYGRECKG